jgi:UDP-2-acetamido-2-deoxy-ribo-hexuluronate aminotransferase
MKFHDLTKQYQLIKKEMLISINKVLDSGNFIQGQQVIELENKLSDFVGAKYCISTSNGTDALILSLMSLSIGPGDEVITPAFSYIACAESIKMVGAKPIFVDVKKDTFNIDVNLIESKISKKTKAIMPVSLYGQMYDYLQLNSIAKKYQIPVIEDAAQSFGAQSYGKMSCNISDIGCTSFFPTKPLGCYGDGGAIFTNSRKLYKKLLMLREHGQSKKYEHANVGLNARLDTLQAAVLLEKIKIFPNEIALRNKIASWYTDLLKNNDQNIITPTIEEQNKSVFAQFTIKTNQRNKVIEKLIKANIPHAIHYPKAIPNQTAYKNYGQKDYPISTKLAKSVLSLPFHPYLDKKSVEYVTSVLLD